MKVIDNLEKTFCHVVEANSDWNCLRQNKMVRSEEGDCKKNSLQKFCYKRIQENSGINERNFLDKRYFSNFDANGKDSNREIFDNASDRC